MIFLSLTSLAVVGQFVQKNFTYSELVKSPTNFRFSMAWICKIIYLSQMTIESNQVLHDSFQHPLTINS